MEVLEQGGHLVTDFFRVVVPPFQKTVSDDQSPVIWLHPYRVKEAISV
jgi:hypothetical protein